MFWLYIHIYGFPGGSAGKESACNAGDLGLIPGLGRSPGEGKGYPLRILAWRISWTVQSMGCKELDMTERLSLIHIYVYIYIFLKFFSTVVYYKIVNIFPCAIW